jgi:hypothetical protein
MDPIVEIRALYDGWFSAAIQDLKAGRTVVAEGLIEWLGENQLALNLLADRIVKRPPPSA